MKNIIKNVWTNKFGRNLILFILVFTPLILIDQLTKTFIFNGDKSGLQSATISNISIIATRSQFHMSTTFLDFIGGHIPYWASLLIDYLLVVLFSVILIFSKNKFQAISVSIALAGIIGNTIDASAFHGARNVFFIPWMDRGTFNFADLIIVSGAVLTGLSFIWTIFKKEEKPKEISESKNETNIESETTEK